MLDPSWLRGGSLGSQTATHDNPFPEMRDDVVALVVDRFIERLPDKEREAVSMCVIGGMSYAEAGAEMGHDKKTVWRWCKRGLGRIESWITGAPWLRELAGDRLPVLPEEDAGQPSPTRLETALHQRLDGALDQENSSA